MRVSIVVLIALLFSFLHALLLFELFFLCMQSGCFSSSPAYILHVTRKNECFYMMPFNVMKQQQQMSNNILPILLKNQQLYILYTHTQKVHKMRVLFMSDRFCICAVTIAVASRHFMLFSLIIIYHLIVPKCFLQSDNFINNPFPLSLFFCTVAYKSIKILAAISDKLQ